MLLSFIEGKNLKNLFLIVLFVLLSLHAGAAGLACDFDADGTITSSDSAIFAAWLQTRKSSDFQIVQDRARAFVATVVVVRLPSAQDKLADSADLVGSTDLAFLAAYIQTRKSSDFALVESRAYAILGQVLSLSKLPATVIGDSTVPVTITGIQVDP